MLDALRTKALVVCAAAAALFAAVGERGARADADVEARTRCAVRLSVALTGESPDAALLAAPNPKTELPRLLESQAFIDRFASFINMKFNDEPDALSSREPAYWLTREVLGTKKPWSDLFLGAYGVAIPAGGNSESDPAVTADANGLGYFRSQPWLVRYAGNEVAGLKLTTAYRIMNNVIGLELTATTAVDGADLSATGRAAPACRGCHFDGPFALDNVARVLTRRRLDRRGQFLPSPDPPQTLLDGVVVADDRELVTALVASKNFSFRACRLGFEFLYGRPEHTCEAAVFDACVDAFESGKTMQAALRAIVDDASFCQ